MAVEGWVLMLVWQVAYTVLMDGCVRNDQLDKVWELEDKLR